MFQIYLLNRNENGRSPNCNNLWDHPKQSWRFNRMVFTFHVPWPSPRIRITYPVAITVQVFHHRMLERIINFDSTRIVSWLNFRIFNWSVWLTSSEFWISYMYFRLPYKWQTLYPYIITCIVQGFCVAVDALLIIVDLYFFIGFCRFSMALATDVEQCSRILNGDVIATDRRRRFSKRTEWTNQFYNVVRHHVSSKKLSRSFGNDFSRWQLTDLFSKYLAIFQFCCSVLGCFWTIDYYNIDHNIVNNNFYACQIEYGKLDSSKSSSLPL